MQCDLKMVHDIVSDQTWQLNGTSRRLSLWGRPNLRGVPPLTPSFKDVLFYDFFLC